MGRVSELEILASFDDGLGPRSASEIVERAGLPRSTVFRVLRALVSSGFVHQDEATRLYLLGPRTLQLGVAARRQLATGYPVIGPILELARTTGETVSFSLVDIPWRVCAYSIEAPSDLRQVISVGARYPLHLGAGRAILAYLPEAAIASVLAFHDVPKRGRAAATAELARFREEGIVLSEGHRVAGALGIAAPVFASGVIEGVIAVSGPADRLGPLVDAHEPLVRQAGEAITESLNARIA
jgi:DNA-binding IclR family transcriptional regulator